MTKKKPVKEGKKKSTKTKPEPQVKEAEKPFDFGGLPDRNIKKNLGCG